MKRFLTACAAALMLLACNRTAPVPFQVTDLQVEYMETPLGRLKVSYQKTLLHTEITVEVPQGMQAELMLHGRPAPLAAGRNTFAWQETADPLFL